MSSLSLSLGGAVVRLALIVGGAECGFFELVGQQQRAFQAQGVKGRALP